MGSKIKLYSISLMALYQMDEASDKSKGAIYWEHKSALVTADSINNAARQAHHFAFLEWPPNDGWIKHSAVITPVTSQFFAQMQHLSKQGLFTTDHGIIEETQRFDFDILDTPVTNVEQSPPLEGH